MREFYYYIILGLLLKYNIILDHMNVNRNESLSLYCLFQRYISLFGRCLDSFRWPKLFIYFVD